MKQTKILLYASYALLLICFILLGIFLAVLWLGKDYVGMFSFLLDPLKDNFGDMMTGTIGILLSFASTLFLFITFKEQRNQFKLSEKSQKIVSFEETFFNIMSLLSDVRRTTIESLKNHKVLSIEGYYYNFVNYAHSLSKSSVAQKYFEDLSTENPLDSVIEAARNEIGLYYKGYVDSTEGNIGYFFRYIFNTVKFVKEQDGNIIKKQRYINLLQSQLSDEELALLFYDAISPYGKNKKGEYVFYEMLEASEMLENISESVLIDSSHAKFYPLTKFKFLSRKELAEVVERRRKIVF